MKMNETIKEVGKGICRRGIESTLCDKASRMLTETLGNGTELSYQLICTHGLYPESEEYPTAYSIIILLADGGSVIDSEILYDISRNEADCLSLMEKLFRVAVLPDAAKAAVEAFI